ncbi:MAG: hypothetical protein EHM22_02755 [Actinobacteria bacterium]|nr:MAG: hypothetical protein EHM22_02755 [Actinomycetota bacterium]
MTDDKVDDMAEASTSGAGEAPPPNAAPRRAEPPSEDSTRAFVRNTVVMSTGTALSRLTGFLRLSAMAFALGITESRLPDAYNIANITPNILYELALGGILTSVVVPVVVEWMQTHGRDAAWDVVRRLFTITLVVLSAIAVLGIVLAPWIIDLYTVGYPRVAARGRARPRDVLPSLLHATGRVLRDRRRGRRPVEFASAVRRADVRADREQPDRHRDVPRLLRDAGSGGGIARARHGSAAARPRGRDDARRGRDDRGAVAVGPRDGVPVPMDGRRSRRGDREDRQARDVGGRLRRREPARLPGGADPRG